MEKIIRAVLGAIVAPIIGNIRSWLEGREARKELKLTGALRAELTHQRAQINGLKKVAEVYAAKDPDVHRMLDDLGLHRSGAVAGHGRSNVRPPQDPPGPSNPGVPGIPVRSAGADGNAGSDKS